MQECSKLKVINERVSSSRSSQDETPMQFNKQPTFTVKAFVVHQLISAYKLNEKMKVISPRPATERELRLFHAEYYVNYLKQQNEECDDDDDDVDEEQLEYGIGISL